MVALQSLPLTRRSVIVIKQVLWLSGDDFSQPSPHHSCATAPASHRLPLITVIQIKGLPIPQKIAWLFGA